MTGVVAVAVAAFLAATLVVVLTAVAVAVRREDRRYSLAGDAPDRLSRNARRLNGVGRRNVDARLVHPAGQLAR